MGIAMALVAAGLAFVVVKKMTNKPKPQQMGYPGGGYGQQYGAPPGYRDMQQSGGWGAPAGGQSGWGGGGGGGGFGAPTGGAAASFFGGGGGGGTRDIGGGGYGAPAPGPDIGQVMNTLQQCIFEQRIQVFYPGPQAVEGIAQRIVSTGAIPTICQDWRLTPDIAIDLCKLALFDIVVLCDDSTSMRMEQGGERINDLKETLAKVAFAATLFDDDGIEVRFFNAPIEGNRINSDDAAVDLLQRIHFDGPAMMGSALDYKVLQPLVLAPARQGALPKPKLVIVITDGSGSAYAEAPGTLQRVIHNAAQELSRTRYGADTLSFQFCQIGNDLAAHQWLSAIDEDPVIGGLIDQTGDYDMEKAEMARKGQELTSIMWLLKMMLGGIDNSYDSKDE